MLLVHQRTRDTLAIAGSLVENSTFVWTDVTTISSYLRDKEITSVVCRSGPGEGVLSTKTATDAQRGRVGDDGGTTSTNDDPQNTDPHQSDSEAERDE